MKNKIESMDRKVVLITGCSSGFGYLTAIFLASKGFKVFAGVRNEKKAARLIEDERYLKNNLRIVYFDVSNENSIAKALQEIAKETERIDILINNAGYGVGGTFEDLSSEEIFAQFQTNFFGVQSVTRAFLPLIKKSSDPRIINISSIAAYCGVPFLGAYLSSKWALEGFSESLRHELAYFGIKVLLLQPGIFPTAIFYENAKYADKFGTDESKYKGVSESVRDKFLNVIPLINNDSRKVPRIIHKLIIRKNPSFRTIIGLDAKIVSVMRRFLPYSLFEFFERKFFYSSFAR
ncbi:short-chain dehydrogenase/reductase [Leptospira yasudae]|uniref:SDR family oxidoreductase n=1 Tax=Leptospira yasudae TaxID=2202201 RepID=UPI000E59A1A4|nr:SDR family oxidoreductase [Leptospira yasudae]RHX93797.1 short-chain dehydrogenase/reductase [Leptospira yasudae]